MIKTVVPFYSEEWHINWINEEIILPRGWDSAMRELESSYALHFEKNSHHPYYLSKSRLSLSHRHVGISSSSYRTHSLSRICYGCFCLTMLLKASCKYSCVCIMQVAMSLQMHTNWWIFNQFRAEPYRYYYPPRELAGYIPAYLALLFIFIPVMYMGLNIVYHDSDNIKWWTIWYKGRANYKLIIHNNGWIHTKWLTCNILILWTYIHTISIVK